jgi:type II secretory pathway predicted ATPase ExeA
MYARFYGLYLKPFENTPDSHFFFPSKGHREVLASMRYGVDNRKGFILIAGDIGTGKTTLVNALLSEIDSSHIVLTILNPKWSFDEIVTYFANKLGVIPNNQAIIQLLEKIKLKLIDLDNEGKRVVLILDEAHLLSEETLQNIRILSNIETENKKLIQIILVGQNEIYNYLQKTSLKTLKQRIVINRNLRPLSKKETFDYVKYRLRIAGRQSKLFSDSAVALIWRRSRGVPRIINHICDNSLLIGYAFEANLIRPKIVKEVIKDMDLGYKEQPNTLTYSLAKIKVISACLIIILFFVILSNYFFGTNIMGSGKVFKNTDSISDPRVSSKVMDTSLQGHLPDHQVTFSSENQMSEKVASIPKQDKITNDIASELNESFSEKAPKLGITETLTPLEMGKPEKLMDDDIIDHKVVQPNDTLTKIALERYGFSNDTIIDYIHISNPSIIDVDKIFVGQFILLPDIVKKNLIITDNNGVFHIHYASFYNKYNAMLCAQTLKNKETNSYVKEAQQQKVTVYRVFYGDYTSYDDALKELENLDMVYFSNLY